MVRYVPLLREVSAVGIADAVVRDIRAGRLAPGTRLPSSRELARILGVHRNTVVRAYDELASQGWTDAHVGRGTTVRHLLPVEPDPPRATPELAGFPLPGHPVPDLEVAEHGEFRFLAGHPDTRLLPLDALSRAYRRALRRPTLVDYGDPQGHPPLRDALCTWLAAHRSLSIPAQRLLVTRGAQQALFLAAHTLFTRGDRIAVEAHGYPPAWEALRTAGLELVPVPVDAEGLRVDALARIPGLRGVYLTPHHQYPTGAMLSGPRRHALLAQARDRRFAVLEDDYDHEFHWRGHPVAPLASLDTAGVVIYLGTLSKTFAPGLRVGWIAGPLGAIERMTRLRRLVDRQGDRVVEQAVTELLVDGEMQRHIRRTRRAYRDRREAMRTAIATHLPDLEPNDPPGGLGFFCRAPGIDVGAWVREAAKRGVVLQPARQCRFDGAAEAAVRLGFPAHTPAEIDTGMDRLAQALAATRSVTGPAVFSRALPGTSCEAIALWETDRQGPPDAVQKRYRSPRALAQEAGMLAELDPTRILRRTSRALRLRWVSGHAGPTSPDAHRAAGRWLRALHDRPLVDEDIPLVEAFARRIPPELGLDPRRLAADRVRCHRDYRPANWIWDGATLTPIDFEHSRPDHPLVDLVKLACEVWPTNPELERAFLDGYGPVDRPVLRDLIALHIHRTATWARRHGDDALLAEATRWASATQR